MGIRPACACVHVASFNHYLPSEAAISLLNPLHLRAHRPIPRELSSSIQDLVRERLYLARRIWYVRGSIWHGRGANLV
jgi:hypothetical protein